MWVVRGLSKMAITTRVHWRPYLLLKKATLDEACITYLRCNKRERQTNPTYIFMYMNLYFSYLTGCWLCNIRIQARTLVAQPNMATVYSHIDDTKHIIFGRRTFARERDIQFSLQGYFRSCDVTETILRDSTRKHDPSTPLFPVPPFFLSHINCQPACRYFIQLLASELYTSIRERKNHVVEFNPSNVHIL